MAPSAQAGTRALYGRSIELPLGPGPALYFFLTMSGIRPSVAARVGIALIVPAYRPNLNLVHLVDALAPEFERIVVIDDGSGSAFLAFFDAASRSPQVEVLRHARNRGKGSALKTGIEHALSTGTPVAGVITADADGQHRPEDVLRVRDRFLQNPESMVLGSRAFDTEVPWRSRFGNSATRLAMRVVAGQKLIDTQTGLRAIPRQFAESVLSLPAAGYEFEMDMLMLARERRLQVSEEPIQTVYEQGNASSHFNPLVDSMRIYFVLLRFSSASLLTAVLDNLAFFLAYSSGAGLLAAQIVGRMAAVAFNYALVRGAVFYSRDRHSVALPRYLTLVAVSGTVAYLGIRGLVALQDTPVLWAKILVESLLFFVNFSVQRYWVFRKRVPEQPPSV